MPRTLDEHWRFEIRTVQAHLLDNDEFLYLRKQQFNYRVVCSQAITNASA